MFDLASTRYAMVTPAYNEADYIGKMIESVCSQTIPPSLWIIVDDGSTDRTPEIIDSYAESVQWIRLVKRARRSERLPGGEGAIQNVMGQLNLEHFDFVARFDADLILEPNYMEQVMREFHRDPNLGIAGGGLYIEKNGTLQLEMEPLYHVRGAVKMYRRACFEQIGGLTTQIGWDTIDEVRAWMHGWKTRSFFEYQVIHRRPTGLGLPSNRIFRERGKAEYYSWSSPLFVVMKTGKIAITDSAPFKALNFLGGFVWAYVAREQRLEDKRFVEVRRTQQMQRLWRLATTRASEFSSHCGGPVSLSH